MTHVDADQPARPITPGRPLESRIPGVRRVGAGAPVRWLARGWDDFRQTGMRGALYGVVFALMGSLIAVSYTHLTLPTSDLV